MGDLAQRAGPTDLVKDRDYMVYWPTQVDRSRWAGDNFYLIKMLFHPGQLLYGEADKETTETMRREAKEKQTRRKRESAGPSSSSSRRSWGGNRRRAQGASGGDFRHSYPVTERETSME
jgi:hypothetical protein